MAGNVTVEILGQQRVLGALTALEQQLVDLRRCGEELYALYAAQNAENFDSEGGLVGGWIPLNEKYAARKLATVGDLPIEQYSGALMDSLTLQTENTIFEVDLWEATFGSNLPYARRQHAGDDQINLPARALIPLTPQAAQGYLDIIRDDSARFAAQQGFTPVQ